MTKVDWYFDFISPYAYLASQHLDRIKGDVEIIPHPVLFAGILKQWDTRGPAEIDPMRKFTYRQIAWLAQQNNTPLKFPPVHPFNPLKLLRLYIGLGGGVALAKQLFQFVWRDGGSVDEPVAWGRLLKALGITTEEADRLVASPDVKQGLIESTNSGLEIGLFGVPAFVVNGEIFWGFDSIGFLNDYLDDRKLFSKPFMVQADEVDEGIRRS